MNIELTIEDAQVLRTLIARGTEHYAARLKAGCYPDENERIWAQIVLKVGAALDARLKPKIEAGFDELQAKLDDIRSKSNRPKA